MSAVPDPNVSQRLASDGRVSAWVAASAGTGKTKVLTDRILNLLLRGTPPSRLLCLTFTKAAAAEMANRLNKRLSEWTVMGDMDLSDQIVGVLGDVPSVDQIAQARRLFAQVLDTPGGMRILTIHAFCQSVLRRFPLEAGIAPHFEVMDDRSAAELLAEAQAQVINRARILAGEDKLADALATVTHHIHELDFAGLMQELAKDRGRIARLLDDGLPAYLSKLARSLGVRPGQTMREASEKFCADPVFDEVELRRAAAILVLAGKPTDKKCGEGLAEFLSRDDTERPSAINAYLSVFLTQKLEPRAKLVTNGIIDAHPWMEAVLAIELERVSIWQKRLAAAAIYEATAALTRLADAFLSTYEAEKRRRTLLDYDDLILATRDLLRRPGVAPWVLYKLDGGLDHVLIDEAQDTNPDQWAVVTALVEDFFAGQGANPANRTIFAVGDAKQSIFSFQRADPHAFLAMRAHFADKIDAAKQVMRPVPLQISFRSTASVLTLVDAVFARDEARDGVALDGAEIRHEAFRQGHSGRVELWPPIKPFDADEDEPWAAPIEQIGRATPRARLARLIAETVAHWLGTGEQLPARGRAVRPGDILVLVRRRGGFVAELVRELKRLNVPVAGIDRMVLIGQIAVMDLIALGQFLLLPDDDLTLATVLKSPLIGLNEEQLFDLAHGRRGTLWQALREVPQEWAKRASSYLSDLLGGADFVPPHELYARVLVSGGRKRLIGRLGYEAADAIDEFMAQSLVYEQAHVPSLQGFLHWLTSAESEVKRDLDQGERDEVRIMTVHGSKGLQAPIVFIPDSLSVPTQNPVLLWPEAQDTMLWPIRRGAGEPVSARAKAQAIDKRDQEYRRLLYVALTRAEDRLYVCGWQGKKGTSAASWYDLVQEGMHTLTKGAFTPISLPPESIGFDSDGLIHETPQTVPPKADRSTSNAGIAEDIILPDFVYHKPQPEPAPPRPLIAARSTHDDPPALSPLANLDDQSRFQRGILIHRLMQSLPDLAPEERQPSARRFLNRRAADMTPTQQEQIIDECIALLNHSDFAELFGPGSRSEVPIVGLIDGRALSARVDRLVVTADCVMVVDYKTNRPPPRTVAAVAPAYLEQLSTYRRALERIYSGRKIRTLLLWTDGPSLMEIDSITV